MRPILILTSIFFALNAFSQSEKVEVIGWIKMKQQEGVLEGASACIISGDDRTLEVCTFSDQNGKFSIKVPASTSELRLIISHIGYLPYSQSVLLNPGITELDTIFLKEKSNLLDLVDVEAKAPPVLNKLDTTFYNPAYFLDSDVESSLDLLEVLPGISIDTEGIMYVNGIPVNKIMINGMPFFKDGFLLALEDVPADFLESVQVTSTKTKSEAFANEAGSQDAKTINLVIAKEKYGGYTGNIGAGGGTNERFDLQGGINSFGSKGLVSVLARAKNTNDLNISTGQNKVPAGLNTAQNYGLNFSGRIKDKIDVNGNYFVTGNKQENETERLRENFLPNSNFFSDSRTIMEDLSTTHTINLGFDFKINSTLMLNIAPTFGFQKNDNESFDSLVSFHSMNLFINGSSGLYETTGSVKNIGNRLSLTKKTGIKGNVLKLNVSNALVLANEEKEILLKTYFYTDTGDYNLHQDQIIRFGNNNSNVNADLSYKFGLDKQPVFITVGMAYLHRKSTEENSVFDKKESGEQTFFNETLSNNYELFSHEASPQLKLTYKKKNWSTNIALNQFYSMLNYTDILRPQNSLVRVYTGTRLNTKTKYQVSPGTNLSLSYELKNELPSIGQMQPFQNAQNPLFIIKGNPDLKVQENHQLNLNFQAYDSKKKRGVFANANATLRNNQVVVKSSLDENLVRTVTYANVSGGYSVSGNIRYDKRIMLDSGITVRFDVRLTPMLHRNINFNNDIRYENRIVSLIPKAMSKIVFANKNVLELGYQTFISNTYYELEQAVNQNLYMHQFHVTAGFHLFENCMWNNQFLYANTTSVNMNFQQSNALWNASIDYKLLSQKLELSLMVYDVLNKNVSVTQLATPEYIEDLKRAVLKRYVMLKLNWKISSMS